MKGIISKCQMMKGISEYSALKKFVPFSHLCALSFLFILIHCMKYLFIVVYDEFMY